MNADAFTYLFKEAYDTFPPLEGKPTDNNLLAIRKTLPPLVMVIPYDQLLGVHSLTAILTEAPKYKANHGNSKFVRPSRLPFYDRNISNDKPRPSSVFAPRLPTNPASTTMPATRQLNVASPNSSVTLLTRFGKKPEGCQYFLHKGHSP
jgi:hypothetical protein